MLTRLSVSGFKNLSDVIVEFGPYTCIAGPNAAGKSNLFDAIEFLSLLADHPFMEAAQRLRLSGERFGDPRTLFTIEPDGSVLKPMRLVAEMIVQSEVSDDFGQRAKPRSTFLRYEIALAYTSTGEGSSAKYGSIALVSESLTPIIKGEAHLHMRWPHSAKEFRGAVVSNSRYGKAYISTEPGSSGGTLQIHADGGSRGNPRRSPVDSARRSYVSSVTSADEPTILAVRQEMQQWRKLALEPSAMRSPDSLYSGDYAIRPDGSHLSAALWRLASDERDVYARVAANVAALTDVRAVRVVADEARDILTLEARLGSGPFLPARSLSDGTLRFLALSVIEVDPSFGGLICMEEPENGIHPARIAAMVELIRRLAVDASVAPDEDNPLRQVIVNTHSPEFVRGQAIDDLLLAVPTTVQGELGPITAVEFVPLRGSWRARAGGYAVTRQAISDYLTQPEDSPIWVQLELSMDEWTG